jgi:predicted amidohydrolase
MGPVQKTESRQAVVRRMLDLLEQAKANSCNLVVYPELALTTFFPRWYMTDPIEIDAWFEREIPNPATQSLFETAAQNRIGISFGYAELTADGHRFNTAILVDPDGRIVGKYRKVHLPGHAEYDPARTFQHLEKRYFEPGDLGFPVWRTMGGIVGMCIWREFHNRLTVQAGAYQNSTWSVAVAKGGTEDGHRMIAGSMIVNPDGEIVSEAKTEDDELIFADCDLDATIFGKQTIFDFARHRRIEHYGRITSQTGIIPPAQ